MKILALHGKQQNGEVFRSRLGRLPHKIQQLQKTTIDYVDAQFELPLNQGDAVAMRTWYLRRDDSTVDYESVEKTLCYLEALWWSNGHAISSYDGIIGFSQGGMIAAIVASQPHRFPGLHFAIIGGAPDLSCLDDISCISNGGSRSKYHSESMQIDVSSLHLVGVKDQVVAPSSSYALARRFRDPRVVEHEMGHCIPTQAKYLSMIVDFIREALLLSASKVRCTADACSSLPPIKAHSSTSHTHAPLSSNSGPTGSRHRCRNDEIATTQAEEYEVLTSIYPSEIVLLTEMIPVIAGDACISIHVQLNFSNTLMDISKIPTAWLDNIGIDISCPSDYPTHAPPIITITTGSLSMFDGFSSSMALSLTQCIYRSIGVEYNGASCDAMSYIGEPCIMVCTQTAYEWFDDQRWLRSSDSISSAINTAEIDPSIETVVSRPPSTLDKDDVDEALEKEMVAAATLEACRVAYKHRLSQRVGDDESPHSHVIRPSSSSDKSDHIIISTATDAASSLPASARGVWNYTVGLVGKPSAGGLHRMVALCGTE